MMDIYWAAKRRGKYLSLGTDNEGDNYFTNKLEGE